MPNALSLGFIPPSFPRDPVEVNTFPEHMLLGQVLEPLVAVDLEGNVLPAFAKAWEISIDGKTLRFAFEPGKVFSDGKPADAEDAAYSLSRHANSGSQSADFLKSIERMELPDPHTLVLHLIEKSQSVLKALSRDQLGVVPRGWAFDANSLEPLVGSGPYRLLRSGNAWLLEENKHWRGKLEVASWQVIFFANAAGDLPDGPIPDFVPLASKKHLAGFRPREDFAGFEIRERLSFTQNSAWWYPHGAKFSDSTAKARIMCAVNEMFAACAMELGLARATGVIPAGVPGYLENRPKTEQLMGSEELAMKLALPRMMLPELEKCASFAKAFSDNCITLELLPYTVDQLRDLKALQPDVFIGSWAGGFHDPEGFFPILNSLLQMPLNEYLGPLASMRAQAMRLEEPQKRAEAFAALGSALITGHIMVPGWRVPFFSLTSNAIYEDAKPRRFVPQLANVKRKNRSPTDK